ncbi:MAG: hypothetical protein BWY75_02363 [bacterium ADurb.Bin425]|nr:MAG: hypothetical protein BWY75_02363 [bacterium ADurb.Bin425]
MCMSNEDSLRRVINSNRKFDDAAAEEAERALLINSFDSELRARLLFYYSVGCKESYQQFSETRFKHISWFVENVPDSKFCGDELFYLPQESAFFKPLKDIWLEQISKSESLARRVNAFMFLLNANDSNIHRYYEEFFQSSRHDIWVLALDDLLNESYSCFDARIAIEAKRLKRLKRLDCCSEPNSAKGETQKWLKEAVEFEALASTQDFAEILEEFSVNPTISSMVKLSGYTANRFNANSIIGFDPQMVSVRLGLVAWIIQVLPKSIFANNPYFTGPFSGPIDFQIYPRNGVSPLINPIDFLSDLWIAQLQKSPGEKVLARNAAFFSNGIQLSTPLQAKKISDELKKRPPLEKMS